MHRPKLIFLSLLLLALPFATTASALTTRVFVASSGNDTNQCTASAPCRTVAKAISVVDVRGEVIITESGDYDSFFVAKSVTVAAAPGVNAAIVVPSAGNAIWALLTAADTVTFRNLNLKATAAFGVATIGIQNSQTGTMYVDGCTFTGFDTAILTTYGPGYVFVHDSVFRDNSFAVSLYGPQTEGLLTAVVAGCTFESNARGVFVSSRVVATIRDSIFANNDHGVSVRPATAHQRAEALVDNCSMTGNNRGVSVNGNSGVAVARLTRTTITSSVFDGVQILTGGAVYTLQNNTITGNLVDVNGAQLIPLNVK